MPDKVWEVKVRSRPVRVHCQPDEIWVQLFAGVGLGNQASARAGMWLGGMVLAEKLRDDRETRTEHCRQILQCCRLWYIPEYLQIVLDALV